jgi:site-specific recombinase XerD
MPDVLHRDINPYWVYLARFDGKESARTMKGCLDRLALALVPDLDGTPDPGERFPWHYLRYAHAVMIRTRLLQHEPPWSPSHVNKHLHALRGVLTEAWKLTLMTADDVARVKSVPLIKATREPAGRNIHGDEMRALLAGCLSDDWVIGSRDAAMMAVLHSTGMRRAEVASALIERYDPGERGLRIVGKGGKERTVYIHPDASPYLDRWLGILGSRQGAMFRPVDRWGNIRNRPLSARAVGLIVDTRRRLAGLLPTSAHDFRRTFIGDFIDAGGDLAQAQQLAGHASVTTTAGYDRRPARGRRAAVDRLHLPSPDELVIRPA